MVDCLATGLQPTSGYMPDIAHLCEADRLRMSKQSPATSTGRRPRGPIAPACAPRAIPGTMTLSASAPALLAEPISVTPIASSAAVTFAAGASADAVDKAPPTPEQSPEDAAAAAAAAAATARAMRRARLNSLVDANALSLEDMAQEVLMKLDRWMRLHSFRPIDLFRRKDINRDGVDDLSVAAMGGSFVDRARLAEGNDALDVDEFAALVARLPNVKIARAQVAALVRLLDVDRSGMLTVDEIERALRDARKKARNIETCAHARARDALDHRQLGGVLPALLRKRHAAHLTRRS